MSFDLENTFPRLKNAPIREAVIDIQAIVPPETALDALATFPDGLEMQFPLKHERRSLQAQIEFKDQGPTFIAPATQPDGFVFSAPEEHLVVQTRLDGFTLSRLSPYHDGNTFERQARIFWNRYVDIAHPTRVTRIAIRNINRIDIPNGVDLQSLVLTGPEISRALPQMMIQFFMQLMVPDPSGAIGVITQTFGESELGATAFPLIFDINAFQPTEMDADSEDIWARLAGLRRFKNKIFFNSLTAKALEAYR
jgi:uncharacterized protein (TIGR04255 family)